MKIKHHPNGSIDIVHEIHPGAASCGGPEIDADRPRFISLRVVGRHPTTQEPDVLDIEGDDEDVLDVLDQMVSQVRLMIMHDGRADPHTYPHVGRFRNYGCRRCGSRTEGLQKMIAIPTAEDTGDPERYVWAHLCAACNDDFHRWMDSPEFQDGMSTAEKAGCDGDLQHVCGKGCDPQLSENPRCQCGHHRSDHEWGPFGDGSCFYAYNCDCRAFVLSPSILPTNARFTHHPDDICRCGHPAGDHAMDSALGSNCGHGDECECSVFRLLVRHKDIP